MRLFLTLKEKYFIFELTIESISFQLNSTSTGFSEIMKLLLLVLKDKGFIQWIGWYADLSHLLFFHRWRLKFCIDDDKIWRIQMMHAFNNFKYDEISKSQMKNNNRNNKTKCNCLVFARISSCDEVWRYCFVNKIYQIDVQVVDANAVYLCE